MLWLLMDVVFKLFVNVRRNELCSIKYKVLRTYLFGVEADLGTKIIFVLGKCSWWKLLVEAGLLT